MRGLLLPIVICVTMPLPAQVSPFQAQKARRLLETRLSCLGCHELDGTGGRTAPSFTTLYERRTAGYIGAMVDDPRRVVPGAAMPRPMLDSATRALLVAYLARNARSGPPPAPVTAPAVATTPTPTPDARGLYAYWCVSCHGAQGRGDGPNARYLPVPPAVHASAAAMGTRSDNALFDAIAGGGVVMGKSARMPAFGATLTSDEIRALVGYIRTLCACQAPAWSRDGATR